MCRDAVPRGVGHNTVEGLGRVAGEFALILESADDGVIAAAGAVPTDGRARVVAECRSG
jgi:hypothetical protein